MIFVINDEEPTWENRDQDTGRHQRNGHILILPEMMWVCIKCRLQFDAAVDADRVGCTPPPTTVYGIRGHRPMTHEESEKIRELLGRIPPLTKEEIWEKHPELFEWEKEGS